MADIALPRNVILNAVPAAAPAFVPADAPVAQPAAPAAAAAPVAAAADAFVDNTPAGKLWAKYMPGVARPKGRSLDRALGIVASIVPSSPGQAPGRGQLFTAEGMFKMYAKGFKDLKQSNKDVKAVEDAIGAVAQPGTPGEKAKAQEKLTTLLKTEWSPNAAGKIPVIERMVSTLAKQKFGDDAADAKLMKEAIVDKVNDIGEKAFDMGQLQGDDGIHELRRQLRWVRYYTEIANTGGPRQQLVPAELFTTFMSAHDALGAIKDRGEQAELKAREKVEASGGVLDFHEALKQAEAELGPSYAMESLKAEAAGHYEKVKAVYAKFKDQL